MRHTAALSGQWQFQLDPAGTLTVHTLEPDRLIPVPLPWQAAFPELQAYSGYAWYRRAVEVEADWLEGEVLLRCGAVDYWCQVFVNGELAGEHEGGYTPFTLPVRRWLRAGRNEIAVRVYDAAQDAYVVRRWPELQGEPPQAGPPFAADEVPHGKQEWYLNVGGIWQDVSLTAVPAAYVERVHVTPDIHTGAARVAVTLAGTEAAEGSLRVAVRDEAGQAWTVEAPASAGQSEYAVTVLVEGPRLWDVETPNLYTATVTLTTSAGQDGVSVRFGFREIAARDGQLLLNGQPLYLLAALDQDLYPETIYTVPSNDYLRDQFAKAKALGLNCLRCHIKPPDPRYLDLADELGLLVWAEIPSWRTFYPRGTRRPEQRDLDAAGQRRVERTLEEMIARDYNHPALIIWTLVNEDWGTALALSASDRAWVRGLYERCKQLDPTRLAVDNSPCGNAWGPNLHVASDLDDFHIYFNIPDQAEGFERAMEQFNQHPAWSFSQHGDARRTGHEPLILSEFGNWGLPSLEGLRRAAGAEPGWFDLGPWWSGWEGEPGYPAGVAERFARLGLDAIWPDYEAFAAATQWHQFAALKFEIETIRRQPNLKGYVITEFTDAYWESNGLLDFYRQPKAYHERMGQINALDVVSAQAERHAYWDDEAATARLHAARYSDREWAGARLHWRLGAAAGERRLPALERGQVVEAGRARWPLAGQSGLARIELEVRGRGGVLARNDLEVLVLPAAHRAARHAGLVAVPERGLERALRKLGYRTSSALSAETTVAVAARTTPELLDWVRASGDLLFLDQGNSPFFWTQGRGGVYGGNWLTSFSWLLPSAHPRLPARNPLGLPFRHVMPARTILGLPLEDPAIQPDVLAGMVLGWAGHPSAHTVRFRYGRGRVIMTTFELARALPGDPAAVAMLHELVEHVTSEACQPRLEAS
jgi:hypothetical protein